MAELVQQSLEQMLPELEQLQRIQILSAEEVKQVIKMRRRFEYKTQKQTKKKEDYLSYIEYESSLLSLVTLRRDKLGYDFKKHEIDYSISRRINKLFRILEHRFGNDAKMWMSHVEFLKNVGWKTELSKVCRRFIQAHTNNPQVWITAAKYELEVVGNPDSSRKIMLEGLRFHPESRDLFKEYFRLEMIYVDLLKKRSNVLGISGDDINEETRDKVLDGEVIVTVLKMAVEAIHEADFVASLLHVVSTMEEPSCFEKIRDKIVEILKQEFHQDYLTWDTLGREALCNGQPLSIVCKHYEEGLSTINGQDELRDLMESYIETLESIPSLLDGKDLLSLIGIKLLNVFGTAHKNKILKEKFYSEWISLLNPQDHAAQISTIIYEARSQYPTSISLLQESLALSLRTDEGDKSRIGDIIQCFFDGIKEVDRREIPLELLEFMFVNISSRDGSHLHDFYVRSRSGFPSWDKSVRLLYFDHLYTVKGIEAVRGFYDQNKYDPPFDMNFHLKALEFENLCEKINKTRIRSIYEAASDQFGKDDIDIWLQFIDFETKNGKSAEVTSIGSRAENSLNTSQLKDKFRIQFESRSC